MCAGCHLAPPPLPARREWDIFSALAGLGRRIYELAVRLKSG